MGGTQRMMVAFVSLVEYAFQRSAVNQIRGSQLVAVGLQLLKQVGHSVEPQGVGILQLGTEGGIELHILVQRMPFLRLGDTGLCRKAFADGAHKVLHELVLSNLLSAHLNHDGVVRPRLRMQGER